MSDNKSFGRGFTGKGYYIALVLCAAAIGITGYVYHRNQTTAEEVILQETLPEEIPAGTMATVEDLPVIATQGAAEVSPVPETNPALPAANQTLQVVSPLSGQTIGEYAMETLSYNQTTRDWRVHNGVDIAAEEGTPVAAAAPGTVVEACEDQTLGYTVLIRHPGGYTTCYASLSQDLAVAPGDTVEAGQTIGYVGSSALVETALGSHLHFAVTSQGKAMDPAEFLSLAE